LFAGKIHNAIFQRGDNNKIKTHTLYSPTVLFFCLGKLVTSTLGLGLG